jgi:hypothetical protein
MSSYNLFGPDEVIEPPVYTPPPPVVSPPPTTTTPPAPSVFTIPLHIGSVVGLPSGTSPYVELAEGSTASNYTINFGLERGADGINGQDGVDGGNYDDEITELQDRATAAESTLAGHTYDLFLINNNLTALDVAITGVSADVSALNIAVGTINTEVDELIAQVNTDLEPRVVLLEEKTVAVSNDGISTNVLGNFVVIGDIITDRVFTTVYQGFPQWGTVFQL